MTESALAAAGVILDGRYRLLRPIGRGGFGSVWEALQLSVDRRVAVKLLHAERGVDATHLARFRREARLTSRLRHPNAVQVIDFGVVDGSLYLVMELLPGVTLKERLRGNAPPSPARLCAWLADICDALEAAHRLGIVHRDLKPGNILLRRDGDRELPVVIDFGLSRALQGDPGLETVTASEAILGTPLYMSPEAAAGRPVGPPADLYAVGIMAFEGISGRPPHRGRTALETIGLHLHGPLPPLLARDGSPPDPDLDRLVRQLLQRDPDRRPRSAATVARRFRDLAERLQHDHSATSLPSDAAPTIIRRFAPEPENGPPSAVDDRRRVGPPHDPIPNRAPASPHSVADRHAVAHDPPTAPSSGRRSIPAALFAAGLALTLLLGAPLLRLSDKPATPETAPGPTTAVEPSPPTVSDSVTAAFRSSLAGVPDTPRRTLAESTSPSGEGAKPSVPSTSPEDASGTPSISSHRAPSSAAPEPPEREVAATATTRPGPASAPSRRSPVVPAHRTNAPDVGGSLVPASTAWLTIVAQPWGNVYLGDVELGLSPVVRRPVPAGRHVVRTTQHDRERTELVELRPGEVRTVRHDWTRPVE